MTWLVFLGPAVIVWAWEGAFGRRLAAWGLSRPNYAGRPIPTSYGVLLLLSALLFYILAFFIGGYSKYTIGSLAAALAFGVLGFADDKWGDRSVGGLKGHFRKLLHEREMTTGAMKALVGAWVALVLAFIFTPGNPLEAVVSALLIALSANALNLVDTRPARSVALFLAGMGLSGIALLLQGIGIPPAFWALAGAALAYLPVERARRGMLGDSGSNLLGGVLGVTLAYAFGLPVKILLVAALLYFHLFTERHSLNAFIKEHPRLHQLDEWVQGPGDRAV